LKIEIWHLFVGQNTRSGFKTTSDIVKMTPDIEALEQKLKALDRKIEDVEKRLPAHSVKPPIITELFELEDEREALLKKIAALKGDK
jgi:hypothetical protein